MANKRAVLFAIVGVAIIAAVVLGIVALSGHAVKNSQGQRTLFSKSQYYPYAYQIFPGPLSSDAKTALAGFNMEEQNNSDGSVTINLVATNQEYKNQTYSIQAGEKLYFIERSLRDDSGGVEHFPGDDSAVIVSSDGYLVE